MKEIMSNKRLLVVGIGLILGVIMIIFLGSSVIPKTLNVLVTRASTNQKISIKNSLIMGEKVMAKADGVDECVINVFVLDNSGKGLSGKQVQLSGLGDQIQVSNSLGRATFKLTSRVAKQYELMAIVNGSPLGKSLKVTFK